MQTQSTSSRTGVIKRQPGKRLAESSGKSASQSLIAASLLPAYQKGPRVCAKKKTSAITTLLDDFPGALMKLDKHGAIRDLNASSVRLLGKPRSELMNHSLESFICSTDRPVCKRFLHRLFKTKRGGSCELKLVVKGGRTVHARMEACIRSKARECSISLINITGCPDRKKGEDEFFASGKQASALLNAITESILLIDVEGRIVAINSAMAERVKHRPEDLVGKSVYELFPPAIARRRKARAEEVVRSGRPIRFEDERGDGDVLDTQVYPAFDASGKVAGLAIFAFDITARKRAEQSLKEAHEQLEARVQDRTAELRAINAALVESKATLQAFYDSSPFLMGVAQLDGERLTPVSGNAAAARFFGCAPKELVARVTAELASRPRIDRLWIENCQRCLRERAPVHFDFEHVQPDGSRWLSATVALLGGAPQELPRFSYVVEDITARKAAEARLQETLDLNRAIVAASEVGIAAYRASGECIFANPALARITGVPLSQLLRQNFRQIRSFETSAMLQMAEAALADGKPRSGEVQTTSSSGKEVVGQCHQIPFSFGNKLHLLHMLHDTSEQKRAERFLILQRDLAGFLGQTYDLTAALNRLMDAALEIPAFDCGSVYIADAAKGGFVLKVHRGLSLEFVQATSFYPSSSAEAEPLKRGEPLYNPPPVLAETRMLLERECVKATAMVPLIHKGRLIGAFNVASHTSSEIAPGSRTAIEALAALVVGALVRIQTELARRESERRFHAIINNSPIAVFSGDRDRVITFEEGRALRDVDPDPGKNVRRRTLNAFAGSPLITEALDRVLLKGEETRVLLEHADHTFEAWYSPVRDETDDIKGYFGVATDITERVRLERQLIEISDRVQANFGQEIHDGLCQVLVGAAFDANILRQRLATLAPAETPALNRLCRILDDAITDARRLSRGLFPVKLEKYGLSAALRDLVESVSYRTALNASFAEVGRPLLIKDNAAAVHLFRIAQEAINNCVKHAHAHHLSVRLLRTSDSGQLSVTDDGKGMSPETGTGPGLGLQIMDYRARFLGGRLEIKGRRGSGTEIVCRFPWPLPERSPLSQSTTESLFPNSRT